MKYYVFLFALLLLGACSDGTSDSPETGKAQQVLNQMKGTYQGRIEVNNLYETVRIDIGTNVSVKYLPTYQILHRIFTDSGELEAALASIEKIAFTAETDQLAITQDYTMLSMKPADLMFSVEIEGTQHEIVATFQSQAYRDTYYGDLSLSIYASELYCDGVAYDLTDNGVVYLIDNAKKDS